METIELCPCGRPLHYVKPSMEAAVRRTVANRGETILTEVDSGGRAWWVPRHYIALHGIGARELPKLAAQYGWVEHESGGADLA